MRHDSTPAIVTITVFLFLAAISPVYADTILPAFTRTFESTANASGVGGGVSYGTAYVGDDWITSNDLRGIIEFPLAGAILAGTATLAFAENNVQSGSNFQIAIDIYQANGVQDFYTDYHAPAATATVATFWRDDHIGILVPLSFDVTAPFNDAVAAGWTAFGVRLRQVDETGLTPRAAAFLLFELDVVPVPEPATMILLGSGLIGLAGYGRKKLFKK